MESVELVIWSLFIDGFLGYTGYEVGVVLVSPEGNKLNYIVRFRFKATNIAAEYGPSS